MTNVAYAYAKGRMHLSRGDIPWKAGTTTMYMALYTSSKSPAQDTDETYSATNQIANGAGYTTGGQQMTLNDPTTLGTAPNAYAKLYSSDVTWASPCTFTGVRTAVIYNNTGSKYVLGYITWDADKAAQGGAFTIPCPTTGWFDF